MENLKEAENLVSEFIAEMNAWEQFCEKFSEEKSSLSWEEKTAQMKKKVEAVFVKYCTQRDRKMSRPHTISWGSNGSYEYDPKEEKIIQVEDAKGKKLNVFTERKDLGKDYYYVLISEKGKWLIDLKKQKWDDEDDWENAYL